MVDDSFEILLLPAQVRLRPLDLADVVVESDVALLPATEVNRDSAQLDVHQAAVLARPARDGLDDRSPRPSPAEADSLALDLRRLGHQVVDVLRDGFVRRVAEKSFRPWVPGPHAGVGVNDDDRRRAVLHDCFQIRLLLAQLGLRLLVGGDIVVDGDVASLLAAEVNRDGA